MALRNILKEGESTLRKTCRPVTDFGPKLHTLIDDMKETLLQANGVGLAAPQVGLLRRLVIVLETNVPEGENDYMIELINPTIISASGEQEGPEGCLSIPNVFGLVKRPMSVTVRAQDRYGRWFEVSGEGLTARAFCHELDHLDGHLFRERSSHILTEEELAAYYGEGDEEDGEEESADE